MQKLIIQGGNRVGGEIKIQGAKNSVLPILAAAALCKGETVLKDCPELSDVFASLRILSSLGCKCLFKDNSVFINSREISDVFIPDNLMREMRCSIIFLGAVLGRMGECRLSFPGGCELGPRPIDMHLSALKQMGVKISEEHGQLCCTCPKGLNGAKIHLNFPSVGATENIMLAAVLAKGETVIYNAAKEPEIADLAGFINACGGKICGAGTDKIIIEGVKSLCGCEYKIMPDRIAAATFLGAAAITGGELTLKDADQESLQGVIPLFESMGCVVCSNEDNIFISAKKPLKAVKNIRTMPYPGFPTDAQPIVMAALSKAVGTSVIVETIFENRYRHVDELTRMGADIKTVGRTAIVTGVSELYGAKVRATDLRGGAALVLAAMGAQGETELTNIKLIDRGYECIENAMSQIGANIKRVNF